MATTEERKANKKQNEPILDNVCNGDPDAREYLYLVTRALRIWDDVRDQDYEVTKENLLVFNYGGYAYSEENTTSSFAPVFIR